MRGNPYVFSEFGSGVNLEGAPYSLAGGQARDALNVHTSPTGSIKKRNGCSVLTEPEVVLNSLFGVNLATDILIGSGGTKLYSISTTGTKKTLKTGLTNEIPWEWVQAPISGGQGPVFGINGSNTPQYWDGVSAETKDWTASEGSVPNGEFIAYHDNRIYIAKGSTLYWSDITNPRIWSSPKGGSTLVDPEDGQNITGLGKVGSYLMIFKERKTFLLTDSNTGAYRRISNDMGCISNRSICSTEMGTFFLTPDNEIVVTDGLDFNKKINAPVKPLLDLMSGVSSKKTAAVHIEDKYYISFSENGAINDTILEFDLMNGSWWIHKIYYSSTVTGGINQWAILDPSNKTTLYGAGAVIALPRIFKCFVDETYTESLPFKAYWVSPWHVFSYPHIRKRMREIRVDALGTYQLLTNRSFSTEYIKEEAKNWEVSGEGSTFGGSGTFGGTGTFGDEAAITEKRFYTPGTGRAWSLKFESEDNQNLEIYAYTCAVTYKKD